MNSLKETVYKCKKCGSLYYNMESAERCCGPKRCEKCNKEIPYYKDICCDCSEKIRFEKAINKISWKDYKGDYVYDYISGEYFNSIDELIEFYENKEEKEDLPKYCYGCKGISYSLDIFPVIENDIVNLYEDYEEVLESLVDMDKLYDFIDQWNEKQEKICYEQDISTVILLDDII